MKPISRKTFLRASLLATATGALAACSRDDSPAATPTSNPAALPESLAFQADDSTDKTVTVSTDDGEVNVEYRFYGPRAYVASPVDTDYQSLIVSVPTAINGSSVDASAAPILFCNSVGGYMPASVADATEVGASSSSGGPGGAGGPGGNSPGAGGAPTEAASGSNAMVGAMGKKVNLPQLALAAGYVVVEPGCRGRTLTNDAGEYYGVAPAAIVDLKAALRYITANADSFPGDTTRIVSTGTSAGGALSTLLGATGNSPLYEAELAAIGAAPGSDAVRAAGVWCPITDLEHADGAYEWCWGSLTAPGDLDSAQSAELAAAFAEHQKNLNLRGLDGFGPLRADNYQDYLLSYYLQPSAQRYLTALDEEERAAYLAENSFIQWQEGKATFSWEDYLTHVNTRKKTLPAFDAFDLSSGENNLFGSGTTQARHFTEYSAQRDISGAGSTLATDIPRALEYMNPMIHFDRNDATHADSWWIRLGTKDTDTSLTVSANIAAKVAELGKDVNHQMYWDEGHGANSDAADFLAWVGRLK